MIIHSIQMWERLQKTFGQKEFLSHKTPMWGNRLLPKCVQNKYFNIWLDKLIIYLEKCYEDRILLFFRQLKLATYVTL